MDRLMVISQCGPDRLDFDPQYIRLTELIGRPKVGDVSEVGRDLLWNDNSGDEKGAPGAHRVGDIAVGLSGSPSKAVQANVGIEQLRILEPT